MASTSLPLTLPSRSSLITVNGTITHRDPALPEQTVPLPVAGARVVSSAADGTTSTAGITDAGGRYQIKVWRDTGVNDLQVSPSSPETLIPSVRTARAFDPAKQEQLTPSTTLGSWSSGASQLRLDQGFFEVLTQAMMAADAQTPLFDVGEFRVIARARLERGDLTINTTLAEAIAQGINLLGVPHEITIRPPAESALGQITFEVDATLKDALTLEMVEIPTRRKLSGRVLDAQGMALPNARVEVRRVLTLEDQTRTALGGDDPRLLTVETNAQGSFTAWVEREWEYDVTIIPDITTNAPTGIFQLEASAEATQQRDFTLAEPMLIYGSVVDSRLEGQPNLLIEVHEPLREERRILGTVRTQADGSFRFIAPATPPDIQ